MKLYLNGLLLVSVLSSTHLGSVSAAISGIRGVQDDEDGNANIFSSNRKASSTTQTWVDISYDDFETDWGSFAKVETTGQLLFEFSIWVVIASFPMATHRLSLESLMTRCNPLDSSWRIPCFNTRAITSTAVVIFVCPLHSVLGAWDTERALPSSTLPMVGRTGKGPWTLTTPASCIRRVGMPRSVSVSSTVQSTPRSTLTTCAFNAKPTRPSVTVAPSVAPSTRTVPSASPSEPLGEWETITYDDFEDGWGNYDRRRSNRDSNKRVKDTCYIPEGRYAIRLREYEDAEFWLKGWKDVSEYTNLRITLSLSARGSHEATDELDVYWNDGYNDWDDGVVKTFSFEGTDWDVDTVYKDVVIDFLENGQNITDESLKREQDDTIFRGDQMQIGFFWFGSQKSEKVYIDEVLFEGFKPY